MPLDFPGFPDRLNGHPLRQDESQGLWLILYFASLARASSTSISHRTPSGRALHIQGRWNNSWEPAYGSCRTLKSSKRARDLQVLSQMPPWDNRSSVASIRSFPSRYARKCWPRTSNSSVCHVSQTRLQGERLSTPWRNAPKAEDSPIPSLRASAAVRRFRCGPSARPTSKESGPTCSWHSHRRLWQSRIPRHRCGPEGPPSVAP